VRNADASPQTLVQELIAGAVASSNPQGEAVQALAVASSASASVTRVASAGQALTAVQSTGVAKQANVIASQAIALTNSAQVTTGIIDEEDYDVLPIKLIDLMPVVKIRLV
jgi:hypothetical protein